MSKPPGRSGSGGRPPASAPANFPATSAAPARVTPPARTATGQPTAARPSAGPPPAKPLPLPGAGLPPPAGLGPLGSSPAAMPGRRPETLRPQGHLQLAAQHARRHAPPTGVGLDTAPVRQRMVERLRADGVRCEPVLQAMLAVPRHRFVDSALAIQAYEDTSLPIGLGQTISKPSVVARMIEWLFLGEAARQRGHLGRMLEIGTGCGYQTALLAQMASHVLSVERLKPLHDLAATHLGALQVPRIRLVYGDGMRGHPPNAPYDSILAAAGGDDLPQAWLDQLAPGGRLVAPTTTPGGRGQVLLIVDRTPEGLRRTFGEAVQFVPLKSGTN